MGKHAIYMATGSVEGAFVTCLVDTWLSSEAQLGANTTEALHGINVALGTDYRHSKVSEWRRGARKPSTIAVMYMLHKAVPYASSRYSGWDLVKALTLHERLGQSEAL